MKRYVHDYDMVIPVYSDTEDADAIPEQEIIEAFKKRVGYLLANPNEIIEAVGHIASNDLNI